MDGASLFLDFDGTLVDLIDQPDAVTADKDLRALLLDLDANLDGRLAIVSGRSLAQLDTMLGPLAQRVGLAGSHGIEMRWRGLDYRPERPATFDLAAERMHGFAAAHVGAIVEEKSFGVALHYRRCPGVGAAARSLAQQLAQECNLVVQEGKMMIELRLPGGGKDTAIRWMMAQPAMAGTHPVFIGDDVTDEVGFVAATALGGAGILVGLPRPTDAQYRLPRPAAVHAWLRQDAA